jgi:hypothetical protein
MVAVHIHKMHIKTIKCKPKTSRHDPETIQLAVRIPRALHEQFYRACSLRGITGSMMLRSIMSQFVLLATLTEPQTDGMGCDE